VPPGADSLRVAPTLPYAPRVNVRPPLPGVLRGWLYLAALVCGAALAHARAPVVTARRAAVAIERPQDMASSAVPTWTSVLPARDAPQPEAPAPAERAAYGGGRIIEGSTPHRLIFFTFDDGPDRRTTPLLLDRLDAVGIKAGFFLTAGRIAGRNAMEREQATLAQEIVARGHTVGSHTVDHMQLPLLGDRAALAQVIGAENIFKRVLGFRPSLIRPPGGAHSTRIDELLAQRLYTTVLWNLGAGDFQVKSAAEVLDIFRKVLERREREHGDRGGVVLLHDTYSWSVDAFQLIWADLWARNCKLLARGEELYDVVPDLGFFYQARGTAAADMIADPARPPASVIRQRQARLRTEAQQRCNATDGF
jgi:peptidoglycan/xylan/chitin deacetylase (PgdA/CDA1 family)